MPMMTLRTCAATGCRRMFPVVLPSTRIYCDEACAAAEAVSRAEALTRAVDAVRRLPSVTADARIRARGARWR